MKKLSYWLFITCLLSSNLIASGGSVYSRFGLGDIYNTHFARRLGFGELGASVADAHYLNHYNPASWHKLSFTQFETGVNFIQMNVKDNSGSTSYTDALFSGFAIGFPIDREYGISVVGGIVPYSVVNYDITEAVNNSLVGDYIANYNGTGGISSAFLGVSYKLPFDFILGASYTYYFGKIEYNSESDFPEGSIYNDAFYQRKFSYHGMGATVGLITSDLANIINSEIISELRIGAVLNYIPNLHTDTTLFARSTVGTHSVVNGVSDTHIPYKLGLGVSFIFDEDYLFLFDYMFQPWSEFEYNDTKSLYLRDLQKISFGFEYKRDTKRFSSFWEQIKYRGGLSYEQTQYLINDEGINQYSVSGGITFPITSSNSIDIGLQYSVRGKTEANLEKDNFYKLSVAVSFGELWFIRQAR